MVLILHFLVESSSYLLLCYWNGVSAILFSICAWPTLEYMVLYLNFLSLTIDFSLGIFHWYTYKSQLCHLSWYFPPRYLYASIMSPLLVFSTEILVRLNYVTSLGIFHWDTCTPQLCHLSWYFPPRYLYISIMSSFLVFSTEILVRLNYVTSLGIFHQDTYTPQLCHLSWYFPLRYL